jgi:hypothetical protein
MKKWQAPMYKLSLIKIAIILVLVLADGILSTIYSESIFWSSGIIPLLIELGILAIIYKKFDKTDYKNLPFSWWHNLQLLLYQKFFAFYTLDSDKLVVEYGNKNRLIKFFDINYISEIAPQLDIFYTSSDFKVVYLSLGKSFKKYIPIFVPISEFNAVNEELAKVIKYLDRNDATKETKSSCLKYFFIILITGIILSFVLLVAYNWRCSGSKDQPPIENINFWEAVKTCSL